MKQVWTGETDRQTDRQRETDRERHRETVTDQERDRQTETDRQRGKGERGRGGAQERESWERGEIQRRKGEMGAGRGGQRGEGRGRERVGGRGERVKGHGGGGGSRHRLTERQTEMDTEAETDQRDYWNLPQRWWCCKEPGRRNSSGPPLSVWCVYTGCPCQKQQHWGMACVHSVSLSKTTLKHGVCTRRVPVKNNTEA